MYSASNRWREEKEEKAGGLFSSTASFCDVAQGIQCLDTYTFSKKTLTALCLEITSTSSGVIVWGDSLAALGSQLTS